MIVSAKCWTSALVLGTEVYNFLFSVATYVDGLDMHRFGVHGNRLATLFDDFWGPS